MNFQPGSEDRESSKPRAVDPNSPMEMIAAQRQMVTWVLGSLALIVATFFIAEWRPLFGGSGFGLFVELTSCVAAVAVALTVTITNVGYLRGRRIGLRNPTVVAVIGTIVAIGCLLDLIAIAFASFRI